ncbi:MAG: DUF2148 domain-containing protein [Candidatus Bathyarchaeia archaeon]
MPILKSEEVEKEALIQAAKLLLISARTAPKAGGIDNIEALILLEKEKNTLAREMEKIGEERGIEGFMRDAKNVRDSEAVVLIGVEGTNPFGLNCGACGYSTCQEFSKAEKKGGQDFSGPTCMFKALDLGIALGSAVKTASILNIDNRIMYRIGAAAKRLGLLPKSNVIMGIPLAAKGKNIFFDRK